MMRPRFLACLALGLVASAMAVSSQTRSGGQAAAPAAAPVTFSESIAPLVYTHCVTCHRPGEAAPFSLMSYEDVAKRGALIAQVTASRYMPPWHASAGYTEFVGERKLTDAEIALVRDWVAQGMPRGDMSGMPPLPQAPQDGWRLGPPDLVLEMPAGFDLPASGPDVFRNFVIPTGLTEDKWVRAVEFHPSARRVVHHAIFARVPGGSLAAQDGADGRPGFGGMGTVGVVGGGGEGSGSLGGWAVGATPLMMPDDLAMKLPKGFDFLLQLHFHLSGKPETEKSVIGLYFAPKPPEKTMSSVELPALFGVGAGIDIPAGTRDFTIRDSFTLPGDVRVYAAIAHAHYLATQMRMTATLPDGTTRPVLWIDDWDFNWQDTYFFKNSFVLAKGTRLDVTLTYDNSAANPRNPVNPPRRARWGEQSFEEMGTIGLTFEVLNQTDAPAFDQVLGARTKAAIAAAGKDGTLGRFLARQKRMRGGLQQLTVFDRSGAVVARVGEPGLYSQAAFSPDGSRLAVVRVDPASDANDIWIYDIATGRGTAVTADETADGSPVWSPDGAEIAYVTNRGGASAIHRRSARGEGAATLVYEKPSGPVMFLTDWSSDGGAMTFWAGSEMFVLPLTGERTPIPVGGDTFPGRGGRFSPDGRFLAFNANHTGAFQVYVRPFGLSPGGVTALPPDSLRQVSDAASVGGIFWRRDGRELFYLALPPRQAVMAVDVNLDGTVKAGTPRKLFDLTSPVGAPAQLSSVSTPDGQRFAFAVDLPPRTAATR